MTDDQVTDSYENLKNITFFHAEGVGFRDISYDRLEETNDILPKTVVDLDFRGLIGQSQLKERRFFKKNKKKYVKNEIRMFMDYVYKYYKDDLDKFFANPENIKEFGLNESRVVPSLERETQKNIEEEFKRTHVAPEKPNNIGTLPPLNVNDFKWNKNHSDEQYTDYELYKLGYIALEIMKGKGKIPDEVLNELQNAQKRRNFIKSVSEGDYKAAGFTEEEIKTAKNFGELPKGWNVHHKFHRSHELEGVEIDYNAPENFIIMRYDQVSGESKTIHDRLHCFVDYEKNQKRSEIESTGKTNLDLIWVPGKIYNPDKVISPEEIAKQSRMEIKAVLKPVNEKGRKTVERIIKSVTSGSNALYDRWWSAHRGKLR